MSAVPLVSDEAATEEVAAVYADIRATRQTEFINNFWRALALNPALLRETWERAKAVMGPGAIDPLTKEMIYVAVSAARGCAYCTHSHTAAARAKGMTDEQHSELLAVMALAGTTNGLAEAMQVPVDTAFERHEDAFERREDD